MDTACYRTPLHAAVEAAPAPLGVVTLLLWSAPGAAAEQDECGYTALHLAAAAGSTDAVRLLVAAAPEALALEDYDEGRTPLVMAAADSGEAVALAALDAAPPAFTAAPEFRSQLLRSGAEWGLAALVRHALAGEPLTDPSVLVESLCLAACGGHEDAVALLLEYSPQAALATDADDCTALRCAASGGHEAAARLLLAAAPTSATMGDFEGALPIHSAAGAEGGAAVVQLLLEAAPHTAAVADERGRLPLHHAACKAGSGASVRLLLEAAPQGALAADSKGWTPLHHAAHTNRPPDMIGLLLEAAPEAATAGSRCGDLPIHLAATTYYTTKRDFSAFGAIASAAPATAWIRNATGWTAFDLLLARAAPQLRRTDDLQADFYSYRFNRSGQVVREAQVSAAIAAAAPLVAAGPPLELLWVLDAAGAAALPLYPGKCC